MSPDEEQNNPENQEGLSPEEPQAAPTNEEAPVEETASSESSPQFESFDQPVDAAVLDPKQIEFLYDIELDVNIELGRAELSVRDILSLQPGAVVELNHLAGDPVEVIINNKLIARGEVIVIDDNFAVRVTDILSPSEIVTTLGDDY